MSEKPKDIVICTQLDTILEEIKENFDPNWEDFFPVSNYPKDIKYGESRMYLSSEGKIIASFLIKDKAEREWKGKTKKVLLLEKESARKECVNNDRCAAMGGFRYLEADEIENNRCEIKDELH